MKGMIRTVCGDITPDSFGFCDTHAHLFVGSEHLNHIFAPETFAVDNYLLTIKEIKDYQSCGGKAVLDAQPLGTGRRALMMQQASEETGLQVVAASGFHQRPFYPDDHWVLKFTQQQLADLFISEINEGMFDYAESKEPSLRTGARAGLLKSATKGETLNEFQTKMLGAVADASVATGCPIMCHTEDKSEYCTLRFLIDHGVPASSIIAAHTDRRDNCPPASFDRAYDLGAYISFDTFGADYYDLDEKVNALIAELEKGREDRILVGTDPVRLQMRAYSGGIGMRYIPSVFLPALKAKGVSQEIIDKLMCVNPAKVAAFYR